jgi:hypothetical protein
VLLHSDVQWAVRRCVLPRRVQIVALIYGERINELLFWLRGWIHTETCCISLAGSYLYL